MQELIERAKSGDSAAMEQLLASVAPSIQRFGARACAETTRMRKISYKIRF
jgi:hypothetical protein